MCQQFLGAVSAGATAATPDAAEQQVSVPGAGKENQQLREELSGHITKQRR
jgi:hypothetical protein